MDMSFSIPWSPITCQPTCLSLTSPATTGKAPLPRPRLWGQPALTFRPISGSPSRCCPPARPKHGHLPFRAAEGPSGGSRRPGSPRSRSTSSCSAHPGCRGRDGRRPPCRSDQDQGSAACSWCNVLHSPLTGYGTHSCVPQGRGHFQKASSLRPGAQGCAAAGTNTWIFGVLISFQPRTLAAVKYRSRMALTHMKTDCLQNRLPCGTLHLRLQK